MLIPIEKWLDVQEGKQEVTKVALQFVNYGGKIQRKSSPLKVPKDKGKRRVFSKSDNTKRYCFGNRPHQKHKFGIVITKRCLYNFDPLKPHFYIVKLGFTGVYIIFLISAQKHRLWVLVRTGEAVLTSIHKLCFEQKYEKYQNFYLKTFRL